MPQDLETKQRIEERLAARSLAGAKGSCVRGAHAWGPPGEFGRTKCKVCGLVSVTPKGTGPYDRSSSPPGDM